VRVAESGKCSVVFVDPREYQLMGEALPHGSSTLLLLRLAACPEDAAAWEQFVRRYSGVIYGWCRRHGLQDADAADVTQNVFAGLLRKLHQFDRGRARFRSWLYRIVEHGVRDWCSDPATRQERGTAAARQLLESQPARRDLEAGLNEAFDLELLELAEMQVRLRVAPRTWAAYQLRCKEQVSLREAAGRLGLNPGEVSQYARRVVKMLARQITLLEESCAAREDRRTESDDDSLPAAGDLAALRGRAAGRGGGSPPDGACPGVPGL
jgi:RNA polymerase sigma factor (sigma-70 family)